MAANIQVGLTSPRLRGFRALRKRNVQLYMLGMFVSQAGNTMQALAESWLVYQLTNSAFNLGLVGFVAAVPLVPWSLVAGALSDRMPRRKLLALALIGEAIPPFILAALALTGRAQVWHVIVVSILLGATGAVDFVSRVPLIQSLVEPDELESGYGLAVSLMNIARIVGPAVGGLLIAVIGVAGAFIFNGFSFIFVLIMLALMKTADRPQPKRRASLAANLIEVPLYIVRDRMILILIVMVLVGSLFILPTLVLLPVFARDILQAGPQGLGMLGAASGVGAVIGGMLLASQPAMSLRRRMLLAIGLMFALAPVTAAFALSRNFFLSAFLLTLISGSFVAFRVISFSHIYVHTPDAMRGRLSSLLQIGMGGTQNVGGLFSGYVASRVGAPASVILGAALCFVSSLVTLGVALPQLKREEMQFQERELIETV